MKKRLCIGIILICLISLLAGCGLLSPVEDYNNYQQDQQVIYVAFSKDGEDGEPMDYQKVADYQSIYSSYNSRVMYDTLTPAEQQIYRILEYALDKEYTTIFFDSRLLADVELSLEEILKLYSSDSPMVQQNYSCSAGNADYTFSYLGGSLSFEITGTDFYIENFSHEAMQLKKEAIAEAQKVYASMPQDLSQLEQARFFFRYLTREVKYAENAAEPGKQNNLYDAFVLKKTQCDGFANAFSLLCGMAKIPCGEKIVTAKKDGDIGHTWNVFCADGVWYNADLSLSEDYAAIHKKYDVDFSFGFSDVKTEKVFDFSDRFPVCTTNLIPVDFMVDSASDKKLLSSLKDAFKKVGKRYVYIGLNDGELTGDDFQRIANHLKCDIRTIDETVDGKKYYYIFKAS